MTQPLSFSADEVTRAIYQATRDLEITPTPEQFSAVQQILSSKISRIEAHESSDRTTVFLLAVGAWHILTESLSLVDPQGEVLVLTYTAKAANRLADAIGHNVFSIHSAFDIDRVDSVWRPSAPKQHGLVLVDDDIGIDRPEFTEALINACPGARIAISCYPNQARFPLQFVIPDRTIKLS